MRDAGVMRMTGRSALVVAAVLTASWLLVLALGVSIPLDALRSPIEGTLSRTLERVVSIEGPISVRPTLGPSVIIQDLRIATRTGGQDVEQLRAGQVVVRLGLLSLLSDSPRLTHLEARDVTVFLEHGFSNAGQLPPVDSLAPLELSLHKLILNYRVNGTDPPLRLVFKQLTGSVLPGQPLQLAVESRLGPFPYVADLTLPSPAMLLRAGESSPWRASVDLAGTPLQLQGTLMSPAAGLGPALQLALQGDRTDTAREAAAASAIAGELSLHIRGGRPYVGGELQLAGLDVARLTSGAAPYRVMPEDTALSVPGWLDTVDAGLVIRIDDIGSMPVAVRDTRVTLSLHDGQLNAPLESLIAGVPFHGTVRLDTQVELPVFELSLAAADVDAATLLEGLPGFLDIQGQMARIELHAEAPVRGKAGGVSGVDAGLRLGGARLSYGHRSGGQPVPAVLDELALSVRAGGALVVTAHGALANAPFAIELTGGSLETLLQELAWPISLRATGCGATLTVSGELASLRSDGTSTLNLEVSGERLGDLAPWVGVTACAATPYTARGQLVLAKNVGRLQFLKAQLGHMQLTGELDWSRDELVPLLHVVLHADTLDPADVAGLLPVMSYADGADTASGIRLDMPVLPRPAVIANADIDLTVAQITHRLVDIAGVSFSGRLRDGVFQRSPFRARIGSRVLQGQLDTSGADTGVAFEIGADDAGPGNLLERLFSSAAQWAGKAGVIPLRWFFGQGLSKPAVDECRSGSDAVPGAEAQ